MKCQTPPNPASARSDQKRRGVVFVLVMWLAASGALPVFASTIDPAASIVGEVTLVIGVAHLINVSGQASPLAKSSVVRVGDQVETSPGGHVHLRFVDGGRVSVRPASRLHIENYTHSVNQPALSAIKFRLDEGVVRSITGAWGEVAKDRFRLNTPVAAIGVKGTDFTVQTTSAGTSASVYTGAIVVAPLSAGCQASLGPCVNGSERLLSQDMKGLALHLDRQHAMAQLVPAPDPTAVRRSASTAAADGSSRNAQTLAAEGTRPEIGSDKALSSEVRAATVAANAAATVSPTAAQLVWGRWGDAMAGDTFSQTYASASAGRESTVGNFVYGLYRGPIEAPASESATNPAFEGVVNFRLTQSAAQFLPDGRAPEPARVDGGALGIDFSRSTYSTQVNVSSPSAGNNQLQSSGVVSSNGIFLGRKGNAFVAGAVTGNGKEAGYFFEALHPAGSLSGITLWGR